MDFDVEKVVREYIDKSIHMSLATARDDKPWVSEVHFVYDNDLNLYFRSLASRRHSQDIAGNPNVAGNIVKQHTAGEYPHAIYFEGSAEMIVDDGQRQKVFPLFKERLGIDESILEEARQADGHQFYKVTVENWYAFGKFSGDKGQKYELKWNGGAK
jgi:uncharacterized protein YhbP (UPF0306 family)